MSLEAGSIAFVRFNADGMDGRAFVAVDEIPAGTMVQFNGNEWSREALGAGGGPAPENWSTRSAIFSGTLTLGGGCHEAEALRG